MSTKRAADSRPTSPPRGKRLYAGDEHGQPRTLGAPRVHTKLGRYETAGGVTVDCAEVPLEEPKAELEALVDKLNERRGCLFESSYDFPGRYARWTMGFCDAPLVMEACGRAFTVTALNERGIVLLPAIDAALRACPSLAALEAPGPWVLRGTVREAEATFCEEDRSRQHSIFSIVRAVQGIFRFDEEPQLGLYGSFGYDLTFQFEPVKLHRERDPAQRDLVLYLPDEILVIDVLGNAAWKLQYEFTVDGKSTKGLPRIGPHQPYVPTPEASIPRRRDHEAGAFAKKVVRAKEEFKVGNWP